MAVTKQTYTAAATWTSVQYAEIFRQAFIDAGLMTEWHDSFLSGSIQNRVLRIVYDAGKTYGTTFYWFMFDASNASPVRFHIVSGWNTTTKVPTGTLYLDFGTATTNLLSGHVVVTGRSSTVTNELIRYTSQDNANFSAFLSRQGTTNSFFMIAHPSYQVVPWIDLNKTMFHHFVEIQGSTTNLASSVCFNSRNAIRRSYVAGVTLNGDNNSRSSYAISLNAYMVVGKASSNSAFNTGSGLSNSNLVSSNQTVLPTGETDANPAYTTDFNPIYTGMPISPYMTNFTIPSDFGIIPHYATNTMEVLDKFVVTAGVEEWEILSRVNNGTANTGASMAFAARIV